MPEYLNGSIERQFDFRDMATIMRYPHGYYGGGIYHCKASPALTISNWKDNNFLIHTIMAEYNEIEIRPDSVIKPLGDCHFDIDGHHIEFKIRKLTPRECLRLMDVDEPVIDTMMQSEETGKQIISNSQLYKMAGNSIVVSCLYYIFSQLFYPKQEEQKGQLSLF